MIYNADKPEASIEQPELGDLVELFVRKSRDGWGQTVICVFLRVRRADEPKDKTNLSSVDVIGPDGPASFWAHNVDVSRILVRFKDCIDVRP